MRSVRWLVSFFALLLAADAADIASKPGINPKVYWDEVKYLASPELKGRATGSPELEKAAAYIAGRFKSFGLQPVGGDFEQAFPAEIGAHLGDGNSFAVISEKPGGAKLVEGRDYEPFSFSTNGKFSGEIVFAGFGITAKEYHYDDYAGIDVKDKLVLVLRHEPQETDEKSVFAGKKLTTYASFTDKMVNAKMHGARGVILVNDVDVHPKREDKLEKFGVNDGPRDAGIFFVQVKAAIADHWLKADGKSLGELQAGIDRDLKPNSFALTNTKIELGVNVIHDTKTVHNVAGYLPGSTPEYIIIGAHYDHLGMGDSHSLAPGTVGKAIHPGADDNASGTAGVIELARYFSSTYKDSSSSKDAKLPRRGILFLTFAGEELGLLGSSWYANHPELPNENAVAMLNLDMIGRIRDGRVFVSGAETGSTFAKLLEDVTLPEPLHMDQTGKDSGTNMSDASDHASFVAKQIPVLFFFSGLHGDYHKPGDTADKIDANNAAKLLDYVAQLTEKIGDTPDRPQFVRAERHPAGPISGVGGGTQSGYGPDFGSIPDFNEPPKGVRFADIRAGSPAAKAGLRAADILIEFAGKEIGNLYDFTYALRNHQPGETVLVKVLRGNQTIEAKVLLTERR